MLFCFLVFMARVGQAQNPFYQLINDEAGLPSNEVYSLLQDYNGFIWLGCDAGLYRYNGVSFTRYVNANQKSAAITGLLMAEDSLIYCSNFSNQIFYIRQDSLYEIESWEGKRKYGFPGMALLNNKTICVSSESGLYSYNSNNKTWQLKQFGSNTIGNEINLITGNGQGVVWFGSSWGIGNTAGEKYPVVFEAGSSKNIAEYILCAADNAVWLFSIAGGNIFHLQQKEFVAYQSAKLRAALNDRKLTSVKAYGSKLYITTYSGVLLYDTLNDDLEEFYTEEIFSNSCIDKEQNVWLTTLRNGIYFIPDISSRVWNKAESKLPENRITDITVSEDDVYFAMQNGFIGKLNTAANTVSTYTNKVSADIRGLFWNAEDNQLYFNTNNTLYCLGANSTTAVSDKVGPVKKIVKAGDRFIVCTSLGAFSYTNFNQTLAPEKLTSLWSRDAVYLPVTKEVFIATNNGLLQGKWQADNFVPDTLLFKNTQIVSLFLEEEEQVVYSLNFKGEIYKTQGSSTTLLCRLPNPTLCYDLVKHKQQIYVATLAGLWRYHTMTNQWNVLNRFSSLASNDVHALSIAFGSIWLATSKGLQSIALNHTWDKPLPKIYLKQVTVNGIKADPAALKLNFGSTISVYAEAVAYSSRQQFEYAYRISGSDTNWRYVSSATAAITIEGIKPGNFTIQVKALDYKGRSSQNTIEIKGLVIAPFWQRWWFYVLIAVSGTALAYLIFVLRLKAIREKQQITVEKIQIQNELKLSQEAALKAQMNPHFIFNVMNSIKSFIYENDKKSAAEYLSKFAELVRGILTMSSLPTVKLRDEVKALELYIQLEAMLLEPPFTYKITVAENVDVDAIAIPSLIIQPFVENAFKHGLRHQLGDKILLINIESNPNANQLKITIEDNGVGRKKSAELNQANVPSHTSFATIANTKRLALLNKESEQKVSVHFEDKEDENGKVTGTLVTLNISI